LGFGLLAVACLAASACGGKEPMYKPQGAPKIKLSMRLAKLNAFPGAEEVELPKGKEVGDPDTFKMLDRIFVNKEPILTNEDVVGTSVVREKNDDPDHWRVRIFLTPTARERLARVSRENVGNYIAIIFDGRFEMSPRINSELPDGIADITNMFDKAQATTLAKEIVGQ
jgi:preprotein translocase subunit SecD